MVEYAESLLPRLCGPHACDLTTADARPLACRRLVKTYAFVDHRACVRAAQAGGDTKKCGLACAAWTEDAHHLAALQRERYVIQQDPVPVGPAVSLRYCFQAKD